MTRAFPQLTDEELIRVPGATILASVRCRDARGAPPLAGTRRESAGSTACCRSSRSDSRFVNVLDEPLEATYVFPLPDRAAVRGFRMEIGRRIIEGVLEERAKAREHYDHAIACGPAGGDRRGRAAQRLHSPGGQHHARRDGDGSARSRWRPSLFRRRSHVPVSAGRRSSVHSRRWPFPGPQSAMVRRSILMPFPTPRESLPRCSCRAFPTRFASRWRSISMTPAVASASTMSVPACTRSKPRRKRAAFASCVDPGERLDRDFILRFRLGSRDPAKSIGSTLTHSSRRDDDGRNGTFALTLFRLSGVDSLGSSPRRRLRARSIRLHGGLEDRGGAPGFGAG